MTIASNRVVACGITGAGKDYSLRRFFASQCPRLVVVDYLGEHEKGITSAPVYRCGVADLRKTVRAALGKSDRWQVIVECHDEGTDSEKIARFICPVGPQENSWVYQAGGIGLYCSELDLLAPQSCDSLVTGMWRRGRHYDLSIYGATQRPAGVSRIVTAMSDYLVVCKMHEPRDLAYMTNMLPPGAMDRVVALDWHEVVLVDVRGGRWWLYNSSSAIVASGGQKD